jgi:hypothetical protein
VIPVFLISRRVHGQRAAVISALLIALYPVLLALSACTYSEGLYATLLLSGLCCGLMWQESRKNRYAIVSGLFLGLAYLTRPEALAYPVVLALVVLISTLVRRENWKQSILQCAWMAICIAALATPYVVYLWRHTGQIRLEGKSEVNYVIGARLNSGIPSDGATWGLDPDGSQQGPLLNPNRYIGTKPYPKHVGQMVRYLITSARRNFWELRHLSLFRRLFWPLLVISVFAFLPRTRTRERLRLEILPICFFAFACLPLAIAPVFSVGRLLLPIIPLALLWPSKGVAEISSWGESIFYKSGYNAISPRTAGWIAAAGAGVLLLFFGMRVLQQFPELLSTSTDVSMKEAGIWLRQYDAGPKRIMAGGTIVPYYAEGTWMPMPWAEAPLTLKYIGAQNPNFLVLNLAPWNTRALELREQLDREPKAQFLREFSSSSSSIRIYQWSP